MDRKMKILIAYDGSEGADAVLNNLPEAGLPGRAEARVVVSDVWPTSSPAEFTSALARLAGMADARAPGCLLTKLVANSPCTVEVVRAPMRATAAAFPHAARAPFHAAARAG